MKCFYTIFGFVLIVAIFAKPTNATVIFDAFKHVIETISAAVQDVTLGISEVSSILLGAEEATVVTPYEQENNPETTLQRPPVDKPPGPDSLVISAGGDGQIAAENKYSIDDNKPEGQPIEPTSYVDPSKIQPNPEGELPAPSDSSYPEIISSSGNDKNTEEYGPVNEEDKDQGAQE